MPYFRHKKVKLLPVKNKTNLSKGKYYIGLMSGTSADGIDLALVGFSVGQQPLLVASYYQPYSSVIADKITSLYQPDNNEVDRAFQLDVELAKYFVQAIAALLKQESLTSQDIIAIGNHGQTIRHRPSGTHPFTLQIGCCQTLATLTGIRVIGQFRRKDMVLGGQGAPLVPIFHQQLFAGNANASFVVNIGGIANITFLPEQGSSQTVLGFDTGPGNALLNDWYLAHHQNSEILFDKNGAWAETGQVNQSLLTQLMQDDYIKLSAPKSTGREYFNLEWLNGQIKVFDLYSSEQLSPVDIQATLLAFTTASISHAIKGLSEKGRVYLCGGGVHNSVLVSCLNQAMNHPVSAYEINTMEAVNIDGDILEAMAFAWLAYAFDEKLYSNMPAVTGASASCTLGSEFLP